MSPIREFITHQPDPDARPSVEFMLDGVKLIARRPKSAALLELARLADSESSVVVTVQAAKQFIDDCLTPESREHVNTRLYDPEDVFDYGDLTPILEWVVEEFTRPEERPSTATVPTPVILNSHGF